MEEDGDVQYVNEKPFPGVSSEFRTSVIQAKRALYNAVMFAESETIASAQNDTALNTYLQLIELLHTNMRRILQRSGPTTNQQWILEQIPESARDSVSNLVQVAQAYMATNPVHYDKLLYDDYIYTSLHEYPYVQNEEFLGD
jgi:hypothetical protein